MADRPSYCCGVCPAVEPNPAHPDCEVCRTGYDCTCRDNPRCPNYQEPPMTTPKTYRKRPVEVRAMRLIGTAGETAQVTGWMNREGYPWLVGDATQPDTLRDLDLPDDHRPSRGIYIDPANGNLLIRTLEGDMRATYGDYIIQGVAGEFYPCKPDIFDRTYKRTYEENPND